jgi:dihydrofolate reductase
MKEKRIIVARDKNRVIGHGPKMPPWQNTDDFKKNFARKTKGCPMIMGGNTAMWFLEEFGGPLGSERTSIALTNNPERRKLLTDAGFLVASTMDEALLLAETAPGDIIWIIGGGQIYEYALKHVHIDEIHITHIRGEFPAPEGIPEIHFPAFDISNYHFDPSRYEKYEVREPIGKDKGNKDLAEVFVYRYF